MLIYLNHDGEECNNLEIGVIIAPKIMLRQSTDKLSLCN